jgi:rfaE bifunctional protein nucleotidyltransferase chain/domain
MKFDTDGHIFDEAELERFCAECRQQSKKIVLATGGFDLLHPGHLRFLEKAREYGDVLIVGINDDDYIRRTKGANRPILNQDDRAYLVAGFRCVSCVYIIAKDMIKRVRPDIFMMSTTSIQKPDERGEHYELVERYGGKVVVLEPFSNTHSSDLIEVLADS